MYRPSAKYHFLPSLNCERYTVGINAGHSIFSAFYLSECLCAKMSCLLQLRGCYTYCCWCSMTISSSSTESRARVPLQVVQPLVNVIIYFLLILLRRRCCYCSLEGVSLFILMCRLPDSRRENDEAQLAKMLFLVYFPRRQEFTQNRHMKRCFQSARRS